MTLDMDKTARPVTNATAPPDAAPPDAAPQHRAGRSGAFAAIGRWTLVLLGAVAVAAATYFVSNSVPATYSSSATVSVFVSGNNANDTTQGANNLASQYAQMVGAAPVLSSAKRSLGRDGIGLSSAISGGTVAGQNLVSIRATGSSPAQAQRRAIAVTTNFLRFVRNQTHGQALAFVRQSEQGLAPLNRQIAGVSKQLNGFSTAAQSTPRYSTLQQTLATLIGERSAQQANIAQTIGSGQPTLAVVDPAGSGGKVAPKPSLYALAGFVVALLVFGRLAVYLDPRRQA